MALDISPLWIVAGLVLFVLGGRWAVMRRASSDYQRTKAGLPGMRSSFWHGFWAMLRVGVVVALILAGLALYDLRGRNVNPGDVLSRLRDRVPATQVKDHASPSPSAGRSDPRTKDGNVICFSAKCRRQHPEKQR
jgi:hypothetical protein